jgi:hypothetical protein
MHVAILFLILSIFFEVYISKVITDSLNNEIKSNLMPLIKENVVKYNNASNGRIDDVKKHVDFDKLYKLYDKQSPETVNNNKWVTETIIILNVLVFCVLLTIIGTSLYLGKQVPIKELLVENLIIFLFVGMIEAGFFIAIISHYIPSPPSEISIAAVHSMKKHLTPE